MGGWVGRSPNFGSSSRKPREGSKSEIHGAPRYPAALTGGPCSYKPLSTRAISSVL